MQFLILSVLLSYFLQNVWSIDCYWNSECKHKYFSSKTPYENIRGDIRDSFIKPKGCEPISAWALMRHGKKSPGIKFLKDIKVVLNYKEYILSSYDNGNSSFCAQDIDNLRNWDINEHFDSKPNEITNDGYQEMVGIGRRLKRVLPELFADLHEGNYLFRTTFNRRTDVSVEAFIEGLNNKNLTIDKVKPPISIGNAYATCKKYLKDVLQNPDTYNRALAYMQSADFLAMQQRVESKLGLNFTLTNKNIIAMYDLCRYSWDGFGNNISPWCAVFSVKDLQVHEYLADLEHYSKNGYGVSQFAKIFGQIPMADLFRNLKLAKNGKGKKIVVYFSHSAMMDMIVVALNIFKDANPLTEAHTNLNRKWRNAFISTFGTNIIAVLYRCEESDRDESDHKIAFYWNERPFLELCEEGVCSWQKFETIFKLFLNATIDFCEIDSKQ